MAELTYNVLKLLPRNTLSRMVGAACRVNAPRPIQREGEPSEHYKVGVRATRARPRTRSGASA